MSKLIAFADANGLDRKRRVALNGIKLDGSVADPIARLWPQTERIRAYLIDRHEGDETRLREAIESLSRYLDAPLPGLWYENLAADGRFVVEAAPATSLYHIVGAIGGTLERASRRIRLSPLGRIERRKEERRDATAIPNE